MRTIFVLLALTGLAYAAEPVSVRPPQFPTVRPNLAADRLIERQTAFLLASVAPGEVPNELGVCRARRIPPRRVCGWARARIVKARAPR
jgi:hypothetical protein